ncbi:sugar ABC transporter substrate-binding protein [Phytohabitans sp. ZYX-F-186]|uniref:Sugar ABC transporter substrate-binding protein n=1 Tax=Phytohabitans maris TaxID=3071409 RepID=A0ABU0ZYH3_9ACTN|nr:sugar ABC transporter substrate-binding protein [Phytohabitans sp. ZYX-F-186]MDQ7911225.1 sugar ABC transporter substrate-binding protein [Phytohabitans sp. ZYX-F-186]
MDVWPAQRWRLGAGLTAAAAAAALVAGCSTADTAGDTSSSGSGSSSAEVSYARGQIEKYLKQPPFQAQGPAIDAKAAAGKSVFFVPNTSTIPFTLAVQKAFEQIAGSVGVNLTVWPSTGQTSQWVQGIEQAIAQKADVIVLAAPPQLLAPQLAQAAAAGIPVVVPHQYDPTMPIPANVAAVAYAPFTDAARLMADWAILQRDAAAHALVITTNESPPSKPMAEAIADEFAKHCPKCTATEINVPAADWASKMQSEVQAALLKDPGIDYVIPLFDSSSQYVASAITAAGKKGSVGIATFNNTPFVLEMLQNKNVVEMEVGESIAWIGYVTMDQALRILVGQPPLTNASSPLRVFTGDNIGELGTPPQNEAGYTGYVDGYRKLWGLAS